MIDTLRLARQLRDAGIPETHAEAIVNDIREAVEPAVAQLATKQDLDALRTATRQDLDALATKAELREEVLKLERRIDGLEHKIDTLGKVWQRRCRTTIRLGQLPPVARAVGGG